MADREIKGQVVVITGASSGFGKGAARKFALQGASVVLAARREYLLQDLADVCEQAGGRALVVPTDVTQEAEVAELAERAVSEFSRIDTWVNNAGGGALGRFEDIPVADHVQVIQIDLLGTLYGSYHAIKQFRRQGHGTLINIASLVGKVPAPYLSSYAAAKHGVVGLSAALRQELQQEGVDTIRVCTVLPAAFDTPFFEHAAQYTGREASPIPPTYDPQEVVDAIVDLAANPKDEVSVGTAAKVVNLLHQWFPGMVESGAQNSYSLVRLDAARINIEGTGTATSRSLPIAAHVARPLP